MLNNNWLNLKADSNMTAVYPSFLDSINDSSLFDNYLETNPKNVYRSLGNPDNDKLTEIAYYNL